MSCDKIEFDWGRRSRVSKIFSRGWAIELVSPWNCSCIPRDGVLRSLARDLFVSPVGVFESGALLFHQTVECALGYPRPAPEGAITRSLSIQTETVTIRYKTCSKTIRETCLRPPCQTGWTRESSSLTQWYVTPDIQQYYLSLSLKSW